MANFLHPKQLFVTAMILSVAISASAYDFEIDGFYYNQLSDSTVEVTYESSTWNATTSYLYKHTITIPSSITVDGQTYTVTAIGESAFNHCRNLSSITMPVSITTIKRYAFESCSSLASVDIPDCVSSIEYGAFYGCSKLSSIEIPDKVISIGEMAFGSCSNLTSVALGRGVGYIGIEAFFGCSSLASINVSESNENFKSENGVLYNKEMSELVLFPQRFLQESFVFPNSVTRIGHAAFARSDIKSLSIPNSIKEIGESAFYRCKNLQTVNIGNGVTIIERSAFHSCTNLTSMAIPDAVTEIGERAFYDCESLTSVKIPDGLKKISPYLFAGCTNLASITIPSGVTEIGEHAFEDCSSLTSITIPEGVTSITAATFYGCKNLTSITIPEEVTTIDEYAFEGCSGLVSLTIPERVSSIGWKAFYDCSSLTSLYCNAIVPPTCYLSDIFNEEVDKTKCTLYVPGASVSKYKSTAPWSEFSSIIGVYETCEAPTITFDNETKMLTFASATKGVEYHCTITSEDMMSNRVSESDVALTGVYNVSVYASAEGMINSETTTVKLCWVSAAIEGTNILSANASRGVIVSTHGNNIHINGTISGELIEVYNVCGSMLKSLNANDEDTTISGLNTGNVYIVKIGGTSVKVAL